MFTLVAGVVSLPMVFLTVFGEGAPPEQKGVFAIATFVVGLLIGPLATAIILHGAFQDMRGMPVRLGDSISNGLSRLFPLIGVILLQTLGAMVGALFLIIPAFILMVMWYVAIPACVVEGTGPVGSLRRSRELTKGFRWKIFGLFLIAMVIGSLGGAVLPAALGAVAGYEVQIVVMLIWQGLSSAFGAVMIVVSYYYLRLAKEGMDIDQIASVFD